MGKKILVTLPFIAALVCVSAIAQEVVKKGATKDQFLAQIKTDDLGWNVNGPPWNQPARVDAFYAELSRAK